MFLTEAFKPSETTLETLNEADENQIDTTDENTIPPDAPTDTPDEDSVPEDEPADEEVDTADSDTAVSQNSLADPMTAKKLILLERYREITELHNLTVEKTDMLLSKFPTNSFYDTLLEELRELGEFLKITNRTLLSTAPVPILVSHLLVAKTKLTTLIGLLQKQYEKDKAKMTKAELEK